MKPKVLITTLTSCSGCISTLMSLDVFPQFFKKTKVLYFPFMSDEKKIVDCDIALIEGCISEDSQIDTLKMIRKRVRKVYALGTCAAFGGILSLSKRIRADPISDYIEIDGFIPGCPPPSKLLGNCLIKLIENKEFKLSSKNLCSECSLKSSNYIFSNKRIEKLTPSNDEINEANEDEKCFLERGILCLGPITREGCDAKCMKLGIPCEGCMGPVSKDFTSNVINFLSLVNLSKDLKTYKGIFYRFGKPKIWRLN